MGEALQRNIISVLASATRHMLYKKRILKGIQMCIFSFRFYINSGHIFSFFARIFHTVGEKLKCSHRECCSWIHFSHNFLLTFVTGSHQTRLHSTTHPRGRVNSDSVGWPVSFMTSFALAFSWIFPTPPRWQIDQSEVSAFLRTHRCKHLFMGFLLMHSMLGKAQSTTFL